MLVVQAKHYAISKVHFVTDPHAVLVYCSGPHRGAQAQTPVLQAALPTGSG